MAECKQILVVEDDELLADLLGRILSRAGFDVSHAYDGTQALEALAEVRPAAIILDGTMPEISGLDVLKNVKTNPTTAAIPVLMLSGRAREEDISNGLSLGADDYIVKPFMRENFLARLHKLLPG